MLRLMYKNNFNFHEAFHTANRYKNNHKQRHACTHTLSSYHLSGGTSHHKVLRAYCFLSDLYLTDTSSDYYPTEKNKPAFKPKSVAPRVLPLF